MVLQWGSTAFLWSQWLIQDLANIYVFVRAVIGIWPLIATIVLLLLMQGVIFYQHGGRIQQIVTSKTMTADIRSATIIDFVYGMILLIFKSGATCHEHHLGVPRAACGAGSCHDHPDPGP